MELNVDKQRLQIKEKLEELLGQIKRATTEGLETAKIHQVVLSSLNVSKDNEALLKPYIEATKDNLKKTEQQLASMEFRAECGKKVLSAIEDADNLGLVMQLLLFIGAEQPIIEEKAEA